MNSSETGNELTDRTFKTELKIVDSECPRSLKEITSNFELIGFSFFFLEFLFQAWIISTYKFQIQFKLLSPKTSNKRMGARR